MERLIAVLQALALGLGKTRKAAMEAVVEGLREEAEDAKYVQVALDENWERIDKAEEAAIAMTKRAEAAERELKDLKAAHGKALDKIQDLAKQVMNLPLGASKDTFRIEVQKGAIGAFYGWKLAVVRAVRITNDMGLKEAKGKVDAVIGTAEGTFQVCDAANARQFGEAIACLVLDGKMVLGRDVLVFRTMV